MTTKEAFLSVMHDHPISDFSTTFYPNGEQDLSKETADNDKVNHPKHYRPGTYEAINVINAWELGFALGNALKYICRAGRKDPNTQVQDLEKAIFYLKHEIKTIKDQK